MLHRLDVFGRFHVLSLNGFCGVDLGCSIGGREEVVLSLSYFGVSPLRLLNVFE